MRRDRITSDDLQRIAETVSEALPAGFWVNVQGRNGYFGLDLYGDRVQLDTLHLGSKREIYTYLQGMRRAHLIASSASRNAGSNYAA